MWFGTIIDLVASSTNTVPGWRHLVPDLLRWLTFAAFLTYGFAIRKTLSDLVRVNPFASIARQRPAGTEAGDSSRVDFLDNSKAVLMVLVVFGHIGTYFQANPLTNAAHDFVYLFHMPAFAFISGIFDDSSARPKSIRELAIRLLLPYAIFQFAYGVANSWMFEGQIRWSLLGPGFNYWYLLSLFFWRALTPLWPNRIRLAMWTTVGALALGYDAGDQTTLAVSRTVVMFPFYALGTCVDRGWLKSLAVPRIRVFAVLFALVTIVSPLGDWVSAHCGYWYTAGYQTYEIPRPFGPPIRLGLMVVAVLLTLMLLSVVPRRRTILASIGRRTMYPFLLHGPIILAVQSRQSELKSRFLASPALAPAILLVSIIVVSILSTRLVTRAFAVVVEPKRALARWRISS